MGGIGRRFAPKRRATSTMSEITVVHFATPLEATLERAMRSFEGGVEDVFQVLLNRRTSVVRDERERDDLLFDADVARSIEAMPLQAKNHLASEEAYGLG